MTTCLGKSCSISLPRVFRKLLSIYVFSYFPFGFEGRMWDLIVSVPDHFLSFYFVGHEVKGSMTYISQSSDFALYLERLFDV